MSSGEIHFRWVETGPMDHYRHAHALDHLLSKQHYYEAASPLLGESLESTLLADYGPLRADYGRGSGWSGRW